LGNIFYLLLSEYRKQSYTLYSQTQFCSILKMQSSYLGLIHHWHINTELSSTEISTYRYRGK